MTIVRKALPFTVVLATATLGGLALLLDAAPSWARALFALVAFALLLVAGLFRPGLWLDAGLLTGIVVAIAAIIGIQTKAAPALPATVPIQIPANRMVAIEPVDAKTPAVLIVLKETRAKGNGQVLGYETARHEVTLSAAIGKSGTVTDERSVLVKRGEKDAGAAALLSDLKSATDVYVVEKG